MSTSNVQRRNVQLLDRHKLQKNLNIHWTELDLQGLLEDEDLRVTFVRVTKHFGLHPFHLNDINSALHDLLTAKLNTYDPEYLFFVLFL